MCGRFTLTKKSGDIADLFEFFGVTVEEEPSYNIAPGQDISVLLKDHKPCIEKFRWGLIPHWSDEPKSRYSMINARAETLMEKPAFRNLIRERRCAVIADGFYEWQKSGKRKIPVYIKLRSGKVFAFAALWDLWTSSSGNEIIKSCTIITTTPNELLKDIHNRMPVIMDRESVEEWISVERFQQDKLLSLLKPYPSGDMEFYEISNYVNYYGNNSPECIRPVKLF